MADLTRFKALLNHILLPAYRSHRFDLSEKDMQSWFNRFKEIPDLAIQESVSEWVNTSNFPPSPADLMKLCWARLRSRPGDYGWSPAWHIPDVDKAPKKMPEEVRQRIKKLVADAQKRAITENIKDNATLQREGANKITAEARESKRRSLIDDYCKRTYQQENGRWVRKPSEIRREERIYIDGKSCRIIEYFDGYCEVVGLDMPSMTVESSH